MQRELWRKTEEVFEKVIALPSEERTRFLDAACAGEPVLRREVDSLLRAHEHAGDFMENAVQAEASDLAARKSELTAGERIGPYRVVRRLGRGGMSEVFLALRDDEEYQHEVAIKVIKRGMDTGDIERRFRQERQILATFAHPNIAKLLDGGTTADGRPYFVMEYINGLPIDRYCNKEGLSHAARLSLFRTVCSAVRYAHQNLVVHRDLKPGNILVTASHVPKLLDFGIAKLLGPERISRPPMVTAHQARVMTPEYASPEQIRGQRITTASDVYSLGVLLYRLLTGELPFPSVADRHDGLDRKLQEGPPQRPSSRVLDSAHKKDGARLARSLRGDLDNIVLKALRLEPGRRYSSVEQFSEDIRRHLEGLPVLARKDTLGYRLNKFVRRHRAGVAVAFLVSATLLASVASVSRQARIAVAERARAERERDGAEQVSQFLESLFEVSDPGEARGSTITARELLDRGALSMSSQLANQPESQARLMTVIGRIYRKLGLYEHAQPLLLEALELTRNNRGPVHVDVAASLNEWALLRHEQGSYPQAEEAFRKALSMERELGDRGTVQSATLNGLALVLHARGKYDESEGMFRQALSLRIALLGEEHADVAQSLHNLAALHYAKGELHEAESLLRKALDIKRKVFEDDHPNTVLSLNSLAALLYARHDYRGAEPLYREVLSKKQELLGNAHPAVARSLNNLGKVLYVQGKSDLSEPLYRRALQMKQDLLGPDHPDLAVTQTGLALVLHAKDDLAAAERLHRRALKIRRASRVGTHPDIAQSLIELGRLLIDRQAPGEAEPLLREALRIREAAFAPDDWRRARAANVLGGCLAKLGKVREARDLMLGTEILIEKHLGQHDPRTQRAFERMRALESQ